MTFNIPSVLLLFQIEIDMDLVDNYWWIRIMTEK